MEYMDELIQSFHSYAVAIAFSNPANDLCRNSHVQHSLRRRYDTHKNN